MQRSPVAEHAASPAELKERIEAERRGAPFLVYRDGEDRQRIVELEDLPSERLTVGRRDSNDVPLQWDSEVSRVHAVIERMGGEWTVCDDGLSRNGSFVNGERLAGRHRLNDGDALAFGDTIVVFRAPSPRQSEPTVAPEELPTARALTETQRKVLVALCRPYKESSFATPATNQQIAEELFLSVDAVKTHLRTLFQMFGIEHLPQNQKRARLVWDALQTGVISARDLWS
jgi:pSer/pThr/pTyr-binding forkhead associated (FHA) protein